MAILLVFLDLFKSGQSNLEGGALPVLLGVFQDNELSISASTWHLRRETVRSLRNLKRSSWIGDEAEAAIDACLTTLKETHADDLRILAYLDD